MVRPEHIQPQQRTHKLVKSGLAIGLVLLLDGGGPSAEMSAHQMSAINVVEPGLNSIQKKGGRVPTVRPTYIAFTLYSLFTIYESPRWLVK